MTQKCLQPLSNFTFVIVNTFWVGFILSNIGEVHESLTEHCFLPVYSLSRKNMFI
jgi:hypothetical protein